MGSQKIGSSFILGVFIAAGLIGLGYFLSDAFLKVKSLERVVMVKGLAQKNVKADIAIFPIQLQEADNELVALNERVKSDIKAVKNFLKEYGFKDSEITLSAPQVIDKYANDYGNSNVRFRYSANTIVTLYTKNVDKVVQLSQDLFKLGEQGILAKNDKYETKFMFTGLNKLKPSMIEEATKNARLAAQKFAKDSNSKLGKIKQAKQGYFSINDRDSGTPYIKKVRIVTNVTYYLDD